MKYAPVTDRLATLGGAKWGVHFRARALAAEGRQIIELTIGEPDLPPPPSLIEDAATALRAGRTGYSNGRGEPDTLAALAQRYTARRGRPFGPENAMTLPGTQTALYAVLCTLLGPGDEVIVADPMYATYDGLIAATGAQFSSKVSPPRPRRAVGSDGEVVAPTGGDGAPISESAHHCDRT